MFSLRRRPIGLGLLLAILLVPAAAGQTELSNEFGKWTIETGTPGSNWIKIKFKPDKDKVKCTKIVFVQTVKDTLEDKDGKKTVLQAGDYMPTLGYKDDDTIADGTKIDHVFCETDPYYNGDDKPQDGGKQGSAKGDGSETTEAEMSDGPSLSDKSLEDAGYVKVLWEFETCAVCAEGDDAGKNYGCIKWKYERTVKDADKGKSTLTSTKIEEQSQSHKDAVKKFNENHTDSAGKPTCPEDLPKGDCGNRVYNMHGPIHVNDDYTVESVDAGVTKGKGAVTGSVPPCKDPVTKGSELEECNYVLVPKGKKICIKRKKPPAAPLTATYVDLFMGTCETVETGVCAAEAHCGTLAWSCVTGGPLTSAVPVDTENPDTLIMYTVEIDDLSDLVTVANDPLSSAAILADDLLDTLPAIQLLPGDVQTFHYPGLIGQCMTPDQLHLYGPVPNKVLVGATGEVTATVAADFVPLFDREVLFTRLAGDFVFTSGEISGDGSQTKLPTDPDGQARVTFVGQSPGAALLRAEIPGSALSAFSFFEVVPAIAPSKGHEGSRPPPALEPKR